MRCITGLALPFSHALRKRELSGAVTHRCVEHHAYGAWRQGRKATQWQHDVEGLVGVVLVDSQHRFRNQLVSLPDFAQANFLPSHSSIRSGLRIAQNPGTR